ncbi:MAG: carbohydrate kinase family protein [Candidatus Magnetobacterium sp. LHC-1]|uniref:Carbohydrate kinase family protein n=1 Tax=Candidatus Magnetobacterium casense TaxID=1455061 RepID=A0ABS6S087_9BACT|nr:carbohydrate kinase family protein [Candidatus Magnetobacterium casensis]MBF0608863.1 carbohydrate kinase family protein [Nitrospirota bacterium]MBV6342267.1 carbohydrate kinase family protein [Candidatus Magnetobacterium casensis]
MNILVSGSLAYDRIMDFPGRFADHILPDKIHILNVCFMINGLKENFGGTAGNIAYTLSLLGETPNVIATAGRDFEPYRQWLRQCDIPAHNVVIIDEELTAGAYITTDKADNQITAFNPGAMKFPTKFDLDFVQPDKAIAIVAPGNLDDMYDFIKVYKQKGISYIFDPGQSLPMWNKEQLTEMISGAKIFISNDYELQLTMEKAFASLQELAQMAEIIITTKGEFGSTITRYDNGHLDKMDIPAVTVENVCDPTGAGDAYRGGLLKGLLMPGADLEHAAMIGSTAASFSVETYGTQNFRFTRETFNQRFEAAFGKAAY